MGVDAKGFVPRRPKRGVFPVTLFPGGDFSKLAVCRLCFTLTDYIIIGGSTHLNASSLHVNIYLILSLVDCNVKI